MKFSICILFFYLLLTSCDRNTCFIEDYLINNSEVDIILLPADTNLFNTSPWYNDAIVIKPGRKYRYNWGRSDKDDFNKGLTIFYHCDSVEVTFDNIYTVTHYYDSLKVNYERSLLNLDAYVNDGCKFTYTFTQPDYEAAKAGI